MSRSPHRLRGDAAECWRVVLFGELVRVLDAPVAVRAGESVRLPRSGRWETGLARIRPALDDALGATAFAVAWRWASAERGASAWPSLELVARKAVDHPVTQAEQSALAVVAGTHVTEGPGGVRSWVLSLPEGESVVSVDAERDWSEVDRIADIVAAWLDAPWSVRTR